MILLATLTLTQGLSAQQLVVGFFDFPPLLYFDDKNQISGRIAKKLLQAVSNNNDLQFVFKRYPPKRFYTELARGNIDLCFVSKSSPIVNLVHYSRLPVLHTRISLFAKQNFTGINDIADLSNVRIGGLRGFEFLGRVQQIQNSTQQLQYHPVNNRASLYKLLASGRVDYAIDYATPALRHINIIHKADFFELPLEVMTVFMAIPKSKLNAQQLLTELETAIEATTKPIAP